MPAYYECFECKKSGVKLWRQYQVCADAIELLCRPCAIVAEGKSEDDLAGDQIGWRVPAVPDPLPGPDLALAEGVSWWGYTSVPPRGCQWWYKLAGLPERDYPDDRVEREERQVADMRREREEALAANVRGTAVVCHATSGEVSALWLDCHRRFVYWGDLNPGLYSTVGKYGGKPVCVSTRFVEIAIAGKPVIVAFCEVTSLARSARQARAWAGQQFPRAPQVTVRGLWKALRESCA